MVRKFILGTLYVCGHLRSLGEPRQTTTPARPVAADSVPADSVAENPVESFAHVRDEVARKVGYLFF